MIEQIRNSVINPKVQRRMFLGVVQDYGNLAHRHVKVLRLPIKDRFEAIRTNPIVLMEC